MKKFITVVAFQIGLYVLLYMLLPLVIWISPADALRIMIALISTTAIVSFIGMYFFENKFRYWLLGIPLHFLLVNLYHPVSQYAIGYGMFSLEIFGIAVNTIIVAITQIGVWIIVKVIKFIQKKQH